MRPELLELVRDIVTSKIISTSDIKESAKQVQIQLHISFLCDISQFPHINNGF